MNSITLAQSRDQMLDLVPRGEVFDLEVHDRGDMIAFLGLTRGDLRSIATHLLHIVDHT